MNGDKGRDRSEGKRKDESEDKDIWDRIDRRQRGNKNMDKNDIIENMRGRDYDLKKKMEWFSDKSWNQIKNANQDENDNVNKKWKRNSKLE